MPYNEIAEHKATLALKQNDFETAVTVLMNTYGTDIFRFCHSMLNNTSDAQDVLQTVFLQAFKALDKFAGDSTFRTWLYAIARNRCLDHLKKNKRLHARVEFTDDVPEPDPDEVSAKSRSNTASFDPFLSKVLLDCMEKLSGPVRSAILMRFQSEHSYEEAANVLQEKAGTLQARVARALPTLRKCIEDNGVTL